MENKIGMALQEGGFVRVYNENGSYLFSIGGALVGYTSSTVSIKDGSFIASHWLSHVKAHAKKYSINDVALILWLGYADRVPEVLWIAGRAPELAVAISVL